FEARQQDAPQAVAERHAEAALERLGVELAVGVGEGVSIRMDPAGKFQPAPTYSHDKSSNAVGLPPPSPRPWEQRRTRRQFLRNNHPAVAAGKRKTDFTAEGTEDAEKIQYTEPIILFKTIDSCLPLCSPRPLR